MSAEKQSDEQFTTRPGNSVR